MKHIQLLAPVFLACLLAACGGGDGGSDGALPGDGLAPPSLVGGGVTGSVTAPFAASAQARDLIIGVGSQRFGRLETFKQETNGAVTTMDDLVLSGTTTIKDVAGDANFAQGRWVGGTVTSSSGASTLSGTAAYHYVAYNAVAAPFPVLGNTICDAGSFTVPTYIEGGSGTPAEAGVSTGNVALAFDSSGAVITGSITGNLNGTSSQTSLSTKLASPLSTGLTGKFLSGGAGSAVAIGDAGSAAYLVMAAYSLTFPSGARYQGMATFHCK